MTFREHLKSGIGLNNLGHAYNDMYIFIIPMLLPLLKAEYGLSYVQSGLLLTGHIGIRSLFSYVSGHLGDIYDKRYIISAGFLLSAFLLAALILVNNMVPMIIILFLMAIGVATFHPLATAMVGEQAISKHRGFHIGLFESTGAFGVILGTFLFGLLVESWGWRYTCLLLALPGLPLSWAYLKLKKEEIDNTTLADIKVDTYYIFLFILARGIRALGIGAIFSFLPVFGSDHIGLTAGRASWLITVMFIGNIFGGPLSGWYSDRKNPLLLICISTIITLPLVFGITLTESLWVVIVLAIILGILNGSFYTPQNTWLTTVSTASTRGKVMGAAFLIDGISVTLAPTIFGWIADNIGIVGSFRWTLLPVAVSLIFYLKIYDLHRKDELEFRKKEALGQL